MSKLKGSRSGINVKIQNESHTSKCSFLDMESIEHHDEYMGRRIKRGIFKSKNGILTHADLQAVYNIIKKAVPEAFPDGIGGIGLYPRSLSIPEFIGLITSKVSVNMVNGNRNLLTTQKKTFKRQVCMLI